MISASLVKELRELTGAGMLDCKKALEATNGDIDSAVDWLREKGISKAAKKANRIAAEGLAIAKINGNKAIILEINSETDFVAKNEEFVSMVNIIADTVLEGNVSSVEEALKLETNGQTIENLIIEKISKIGEKLSLRRFEILEKEDNQVFGDYSHMNGKIVSLCILEGDNQELSKDIAMQIAAMRPIYLDREDVPAEEVEKERGIQKELAEKENANVPADKIDMIVNGKLNKFYFAEVCLNEQAFIKENKMKVNKYVSEKGSKIVKFVRYEVGEGMQKREENFAEEVSKQMNG